MREKLVKSYLFHAKLFDPHKSVLYNIGNELKRGK